MLWQPENVRVKEAVQQLADRLDFARNFEPAAQLLRDTAAYADVYPDECKPLPQVSVFWGMDGTPPLVSLLRPDEPPDPAAIKRLWDGAVRAALLGKRSTSLTKAFDQTPRSVILWLRKLTGMYPYRLRQHPTTVLLAISGYYVNDAWSYFSDGIEFCSPINGAVVQVRGDIGTSFTGQRLRTDGYHAVPINDHKLPQLPSVNRGSLLRALLEQALFIDDPHTLRIAHMLEHSGLNLLQIADKLAACKPRPPQSTPRETYETRPNRAYKTLREVLSIGFDVNPVALADQIDATTLGNRQPQDVCVAALYRHAVEINRLMTTGRFIAFVGRTVPLAAWLEEVPVPPRSLVRWLGRFN